MNIHTIVDVVATEDVYQTQVQLMSLSLSFSLTFLDPHLYLPLLLERYSNLAITDDALPTWPS